MVALAARASGRSTEISSQTKITTVVLVFVWFSNNGRLAVFIFFVAAFLIPFILVIAEWHTE